jgi:hypothetical protein
VELGLGRVLDAAERRGADPEEVVGDVPGERPEEVRAGDARRRASLMTTATRASSPVYR